MKLLHYSTRAKKDLKKYRNNLPLMKALYVVLDMIVKEQELPSIFKPHKLLGEYKGCMECHIGNDFLLIWMDDATNTINIVRIGTHSELFE